MKLYHEVNIRKQADKPTLAMLDLWNNLSKEKTGFPIEVMVGNRREHKQLKAFSGELNTAFPYVHNGKPILVLWMDSLANINPLIVTHEIGHWVLNLQGYRSVSYQPDKNGNIEILLNSLASHVPLYELQRSLYQDPISEIDSRTVHNTKAFAKKVKIEQNIKANALLLADDLLNCSKNNKASLLNILHLNYYPEISRITKEIINTASSFDLLNPEQNITFRKIIIDQLELGKGWQELDNANSLKSLADKSTK